AGEWWGRRSDGRRALELLFGDGVLAAWRSSTFERVYDLTDRVIPADVLGIPTPSAEEAQRELILLAARYAGVGTAADLADYFWIKTPAARLRIAELVEDGRLSEIEVEGWGKPAYALPGRLEKRLRRKEATLLSPFDSLIWTRDRAERLFGFRYRIEIYVPSHRRTHGYYVLPLLLGDTLVGRLDLKADRAARTLRVVGAFAEPDSDAESVVVPLLDELARLRNWLNLDRLAIDRRGNLAAAIRRSHRAATP
ncbi:MAG: crosslink repair DNA glycosylase YcaQ family protein, partial [Acidimicrobiales bacterium]